MSKEVVKTKPVKILAVTALSIIRRFIISPR